MPRQMPICCRSPAETCTVNPCSRQRFCQCPGSSESLVPSVLSRSARRANSTTSLSIGYASLILGFSIEGSELAAILGWGILRGLMRRTSIIENNINQTIASAVNGASAGMMFSVPALFILAEQSKETYSELTAFNPILMVLACITGGVIGIGFIIPLRKQMIDYNRLAYPGGIAVAAILKSPGAGMRKAVVLLAAAGVSALLHLVYQITGFHNIRRAPRRP